MAELLQHSLAAVRGLFPPSYEALLDTEDGMPRLEKHISRWPTASQIFWILVPSFISGPLGHTDAWICEADSTSYLNGLRGIASFVVALQHNTNEYFPANHRGWGDTDEDHYLIQLPFVRLIIDGSFAVTTFFVISGFSLSHGPLKRMHAGNPTAALEGLPSSVFRRPICLFLPILPVVMISAIMIHMQVFYQIDHQTMLPAQPSLFAELHLAWQQFIVIISTKGANSPPMPQAWTLATEYQGSLLTFLCCLAFHRLSPWLRMSLVAGLFGYQMHLGRWEMALFLAGMILADIRHVRAKMPELTGTRKQCLTYLTWITLILSLFLGGWPIYGDGAKTMGMTYFAWIPTGHVPQQRFWHSVSAILLVASLENLPGLHRFFNANPALYLGEISYGLYLVHWMVGMNVLTKGTIVNVRRKGAEPIVAWAVGTAITLPCCIWVADIYWRLVD